jgi:hypothetical protein
MLQVKEYCPLVFRNLRERFGLDDSDFLHSLTKESHHSVSDRFSLRETVVFKIDNKHLNP